MEVYDQKKSLSNNPTKSLRDQERYARKQAIKNFKQMKSELEEEYIMSSDKQTVIPRSIHAAFAGKCLKANVDSSLIDQTIKKRGHKMTCSKSLHTINNLSKFEYNPRLCDAENKLIYNSSKELKFLADLNNAMQKHWYWDCEKCGACLYDLRPGFSRRHRRYRDPWNISQRAAHWLGHLDTELAEIYSNEGMKGIIDLGESRTRRFFKHLNDFSNEYCNY